MTQSRDDAANKLKKKEKPRYLQPQTTSHNRTTKPPQFDGFETESKEPARAFNVGGFRFSKSDVIAPFFWRSKPSTPSPSRKRKETTSPSEPYRQAVKGLEAYLSPSSVTITKKNAITGSPQEVITKTPKRRRLLSGFDMAMGSSPDTVRAKLFQTEESAKDKIKPPHISDEKKLARIEETFTFAQSASLALEAELTAEQATKKNTAPRPKNPISATDEAVLSGETIKEQHEWSHYFPHHAGEVAAISETGERVITDSAPFSYNSTHMLAENRLKKLAIEKGSIHIKDQIERKKNEDGQPIRVVKSEKFEISDQKERKVTFMFDSSKTATPAGEVVKFTNKIVDLTFESPKKR